MTLRIFLIGMSAAVLSGCMSMPLTSMYKLSQLSPLEASPEDIRIATRTLDVVDIRTGNVVLEFGYTAEDKSIDFAQKYEVEVLKNGVLSKILLEDKNADEVVTVLRLSEQDAADMRAKQKQVLAHKESGKTGTGQFSISVNDFCAKTALPADEFLLDVFIQVDPEDGYFVMFEDMNVMEQDGAEQLTQVPLCETKEE
jgi:hypothetical protein